MAASLTESFARRMRVARRGLDTRVAEQLPDGGEGFAQRKRMRGEGIMKVVKTQVPEHGTLPVG